MMTIGYMVAAAIGIIVIGSSIKMVEEAIMVAAAATIGIAAYHILQFYGIFGG